MLNHSIFKRIPMLRTAGAASMLLASSLALAAPLAGTPIGNQAAATYTPLGSTTALTSTSNTVTTTIQQVAAFTLTSTQTKTGSPGAPVTFSHTITNSGNGNDTFTIGAVNTSGLVLTSLVVYPDAGCDGIADSTTPITTVGPLAPNASYCVVVQGTVPGAATSGQTSLVTLNANSQFTTAVVQSNTDTVTVTGNAVVNITKTVSAPSGNPGSGPYTYTIAYTNTGNAAATNVVLADLIPTGMTYVANSARWSGSGVAVLSDTALPADPAGITYDFNVTAPGAVTAVIGSVTPTSSGTLTFNVMVGANQAPGNINNVAKLCYNDGVAQSPIGCSAANTTTTGTPSNTAPFLVNQIAGVNGNGSATSSLSVADPAAIPAAAQGSTVSFNNYVWNRGNGTDSFDITFPTPGNAGNNFPTGTTFQLYKYNGSTPLVDTNGNGTIDTGNIPAVNDVSCTAANGFVADTVNGRCGYLVVLKATLPAGAVGGPYSVTKTATSKFNTAVSDPITDTLTLITNSIVDLRNGVANTIGTGAGPEANAQTTQSVNPGASTTFVLKVNNLSTVADSFNLAASTDSSFATIALPVGWTVNFRADGGTGDCSSIGGPATNTGNVSPGVPAAVTVCAVVSVPANAPATPTPGLKVYFRAQSPTTGATDVKTDAVIINTLRSISISPNNVGQVYPGGSVVYTHTIANNGNVVEGATSGQVVLTDVLSGAAASWTAIIYWDKNNDGILDVNDPVVSDLSNLSAGSGGASTSPGLDIGEQARVFVKIIAPAAATLGSVNTSTLTVTTSGVINTVAAPTAVSATDTTTVIAGQVRLVKEQALDATCDGTPDTAYATSAIAAGAVPGACIRYRITATNDGASDVNSLSISDATPANTVYNTGAGTAPAATTAGTITASPTNGTSGTVQATIGTLVPLQSVVVTFGVRINP
jgi:trimeric autotransporter adhesin